jgi:mRNA-degrading endonuclease RelE of RelBE toxin-antitoxin system
MNSTAAWELVVDRQVHKQLSRIPTKDAERILSAIAAMVTNPYSGDVAKMWGEESVWRRRIGAYRVFYEILPRERLIYVFRVERRTSTTY